MERYFLFFLQFIFVFEKITHEQNLSEKIKNLIRFFRKKKVQAKSMYILPLKKFWSPKWILLIETESFHRNGIL